MLGRQEIIGRGSELGWAVGLGLCSRVCSWWWKTKTVQRGHGASEKRTAMGRGNTVCKQVHASSAAAILAAKYHPCKCKTTLFRLGKPPPQSAHKYHGSNYRKCVRLHQFDGLGERLTNRLYLYRPDSAIAIGELTLEVAGHVRASPLSARHCSASQSQPTLTLPASPFQPLLVYSLALALSVCCSRFPCQLNES